MIQRPDKTEFNKRYNKNNVLSPSNLMNIFECSWKELLKMIDIGYDG